MEDIINVIGMEKSILILAILSIILLIAFIITIFRISNINKKYKEFMKKLGNGKNLEEDLENYMYRVDRVEKQNAEINTLIQNIDKDLENCVQKVGIVRYSAFQDTGSDLSFTLALLDEKKYRGCIKWYIF